MSFVQVQLRHLRHVLSVRLVNNVCMSILFVVKDWVEHDLTLIRQK
jgi:hypothetical protein